MIALLLDANSLFARSWFAAEKSGNPANTKQFFIRTLLDLVTDRYKFDGQVTHGLACWDGQAKNDKGRAPKPEGYYAAMDQCQKAVEPITGMKHCCLQTEAEDQVATAAWNCCQGLFEKVIIASGDKDLKQISGMFGKVRYYCLNKKDLINDRMICAKYGVNHPSHLGVALAMMGDSVDNIGGVPKWGAVKVRKLMEGFSPDVKLEDVAAEILEKVPHPHKMKFLHDLELTVLNTEVEGVPRPSEIEIGDMNVFADHGLEVLMQYAVGL